MQEIICYTEDLRTNIRKAVADCYSYLGEDKFLAMISFIREGGSIRTRIRRARVACTIAGIEGLPYKAITIFACRHKGHWLQNSSINWGACNE